MTSLAKMFGVTTTKEINATKCRVASELKRFGLWTPHIADISVSVGIFSGAYGYINLCDRGKPAEIFIPIISVSRIYDALGLWPGPAHYSRSDILRHEYGHALAYIHRGLIRSPKFRDAFHFAHDCEDEIEYDPEFHFTTYAATDPSEDWAETFMFYLKHRGRLPETHKSPAKKIKWHFVRDFIDQVKRGHARW